MATASASTGTRRNDRNNTTLPPRRGQIKAQIFESMVKAATAAASKAGTLLGINKSSGAGATSDVSPPPSACDSDGNANLP